MRDLSSNDDCTLREVFKLIDLDSNVSQIDHGDRLVFESNEFYGYSIWDIHDFVKKVLSNNSPAFVLNNNKFGRQVIKPLALGRFYPLINSYIGRLPNKFEPYGYIAIFVDSCKDLHLLQGRFTALGNIHRPGMNGAELFNELLTMIRKKSKIEKYQKIVKNFESNDMRMLNSLKGYIDGLFKTYSKLLVLRIDFSYRKEYAANITCEEAEADLLHFLSNWRGNKLFKHRVGYIRKIEYTEVKGYHFHCIFFLNGQAQEGDYYLANQFCDYWKTNITKGRGLAHNCNADKNGYKFCGIGMIDHSDEVKRSYLLYAVSYLTKKDQLIGVPNLGKCKAITKGVPPDDPDTKLGRPRIDRLDSIKYC